MSILLVRFSFKVPSINLLAVVLSTCMGVGGCGWPISSRVRLITVASWPFSKAAAISHSAAEETMLRNILHKLWIGPFNFGAAVCISLMKSLRKKWPPTLLLAPGSTRYAPSLCTHNIMSEAVYVMVPLGNVRRYSMRRLTALLVSSVAFTCYPCTVESATNGKGSVMRQ